MFKQFKEEIDFGGKKLILETGKVARQADGAIIATWGETVVIATVVGAKKANINPAINIGGIAKIWTLITARFISLIFRPTTAVNNCGNATKIDHKPAIDKQIP